MPTTIAPQQPLKAMHAISIDPVRLTFEGAEFDAEDQRNWTDASFKAYPANSRQPIDGLRKGEKIVQSVRIEATGKNQPFVRRTTAPQPKKTPWVGARVVNDSDDLSGLSVDFLRVELPADPAVARHLLDHASSAGLPVHVAVAKGLPIPMLRAGDILIAEGIDTRPSGSRTVWLHAGPFFAFNMGRHEAAGFDGVEVDGTPQIHTFDERSILDNAATLEDVVESMEAIHDGDISLNMSMGADGPDPRLESLFGAIWIMRSFVAARSPRRSYLTLGTSNELRHPLIAALLHQLVTMGQGVFLGREIGDLIVCRSLSKDQQIVILGNPLRRPAPFPPHYKVQHAQSLTVSGWVSRQLPAGAELGPYEIIRFTSPPLRL